MKLPSADFGEVPAPVQYLGGNAVTVSENSGELVREGYTFIGWNTQADGSGTDYEAEDEFSIYDNLTLYAKWEEVSETDPIIGTWAGTITGGDSEITDIKIIFMDEGVCYVVVNFGDQVEGSWESPDAGEYEVSFDYEGVTTFLRGGFTGEEPEELVLSDEFSTWTLGEQ